MDGARFRRAGLIVVLTATAVGLAYGRHHTASPAADAWPRSARRARRANRDGSPPGVGGNRRALRIRVRSGPQRGASPVRDARRRARNSRRRRHGYVRFQPAHPHIAAPALWMELGLRAHRRWRHWLSPPAAVVIDARTRSRCRSLGRGVLRRSPNRQNPGAGARGNPRASVVPPVLSGHTLDRADQIVLGASTLSELHKHLGDTVVVNTGSSKTVTLRIVGTATMPAVGGSGSGTSHLDGHRRTAVVPAHPARRSERRRQPSHRSERGVRTTSARREPRGPCDVR